MTLGPGRSDRVSTMSARYSAQDGATGRQLVTFDPVRITERAQQVADHDLDISINSELELIELADLEALIWQRRNKNLILNKLSNAEIAEDIFAFREINY